jgi:hypothetical protein
MVAGVRVVQRSEGQPFWLAIVPLPIKLELVVTQPTLNECKLRSKNEPVIAPNFWVLMPLTLVSVAPISWRKGE